MKSSLRLLFFATDCTDQHGFFARPPSAAGKVLGHENTRIDTKEYIIKPFSCVFVANPFAAGKQSVLIRVIRGQKKQPQAAFQNYFSGLLLELAGFFEVPDQHIYGQQRPQHDPQPHIAAGFIVAGQFGVIE